MIKLMIFAMLKSAMMMIVVNMMLMMIVVMIGIYNVQSSSGSEGA